MQLFASNYSATGYCVILITTTITSNLLHHRHNHHHRHHYHGRHHRHHHHHEYREREVSGACNQLVCSFNKAEHTTSAILETRLYLKHTPSGNTAILKTWMYLKHKVIFETQPSLKHSYTEMPFSTKHHQTTGNIHP